MADATIDFINLSRLSSEALGEPGQRTFRVLVGSGDSSAIIWLEKEQLFQLAMAINQLLFTVSEGEEGDEVPMDDSATPAATHLEFKLGKLVLGHDSRHRKFIIDAHDEESADEAAPTVRVWGDLAQIKSFADEALRVCAAGRPLCPLCGAPMDQSGHVCPRSNGHHEADLDKV